MLTPELVGQIINLLAAVMLLISFAMIAQRRVITLVDLFALQGFVLMLSTGFVANSTLSRRVIPAEYQRCVCPVV